MLVHWIWLAERKGLNDRDKLRLLEHFRDAEEIYYTPAEQLKRLEWLEPKELDALTDKDLRSSEKILRQCADKKISILTFQDAAYPPKLKHIADPPPVLYYKGILPDFESAPVIGIVGTRRSSAYGLTIAKRMGYQIARCGAMIVSGMAKGIDGNAMQGALTAGGFVIGVLGGGVDVIYPKSNTALYHDLEECGCVISEHPPGTEPAGWHFPKRNRIISGISNGVLVVEAPERSGALSTARQAGEQGRDVFAVPGNIDVETFVGCNNLLDDGAYMARSGWDVVRQYEHMYPAAVVKYTGPASMNAYPDETENQEISEAKVAQKPKMPRKEPPKEKKVIDKEESSAYSDGNKDLPKLNPEEQKLYDLLRAEMLVDDLIAQSGMATARVLAVLTMLQVRGVVQTLPGRRIRRKK